MDDEQYQQLLCDFITDQDQQKQTIDILNKMSESNPLEFLGLNLIVFAKFQDPILCHITITMIYSEVKKGAIFASPEDASTFWTNFAQIIRDSFQSEILQEKSKILVSSTISYFTTYFYRLNQDDQIQEYLLSLLEENSDFESYIINSIEEIVISSPNLGGFSLDTLLKIVSMNPLQFDSSIIPRLKLYFAVVLHIFKNEEYTDELDEIKSELIDLFPQLFESTPEPLFDKMISTIGIFAETFSEFFEPILTTFVPLLCKFAKDPTCPFRNNAIFCIESLCKGSITMCSSLEAYYVPVISTFITIISEITEDWPLEEDLNDISSFVIAKSALRTFLEKCQNQSVYLYLDNFFRDTIADIIGAESEDSILDLEKVPWQLLYAFIYALSYKNTLLDLTSLNKAENDDENEEEEENKENVNDNKIDIENDIQISSSYSDIVIAVIPFLTDPGTPSHLKIAIYDLISSYSKTYHRLFSHTSETDLVSILMANVLEEDEDLYIQKKCASALKKYIKNGRFWLTEDDYVNIFLPICEDLPNVPLHLMSYFIRIMKSFLSYNIIRDHPEVIVIYVNSLISLYESNSELSATDDEYLDIQVDIFISFIKIFTPKLNSEPKELFQSIPEVPEKAFSMLRDAIIIIDSNKCSNEKKLMESIIKCITLLDQNALPLIDQFNLIDLCLEQSNKDINIEKCYQFDYCNDDDDDDFAMMSKVLSYDIELNSTGEVFYFVSNEQDEIEIFLTLLLSIIRIVRSDFPIESLELILSICQKWITNVYHFERLKLASWKLLNELIINFASLPQVNDLINCFTDDFIGYFGVGSIEYNKEILNEMNRFMSIEIIENNSMPTILEKVSNYADEVFGEICKLNGDFMNYKLFQKVVIDESKMPIQILINRSVFESITVFFKIALKKYTDIAFMFFDQVYLEKLNFYLTRIESFEFAMEVKTYFISKVKDVEATKQFIALLFKVFTQFLSQASSVASSCLVRLYTHVELPVDFIYSLVQVYQNIFSNDLTELTEYSDLAVGTFCVLIKQYEQVMKEMDPIVIQNDEDIEFDNLYDCAIYIFIEALPIWDVSLFNYDVYELIACLLEQQNRFIMNPPDFSRVWFNAIGKIDDDNFLSDETSLRFKNIIREITHSEQYQEMLELLFSDFDDLHKQIWMRISEE